MYRKRDQRLRRDPTVNGIAGGYTKAEEGGMVPPSLFYLMKKGPPSSLIAFWKDLCSSNFDCFQTVMGFDFPRVILDSNFSDPT